MASLRLIKKIQRNINDYGLRITLNKSFANLVKLIYENKTYRIYVLNLKKYKKAPFKSDDFIFKNINISDTPFICQIEEMEEWLQNTIKDKLENGSLCLAALDGSIVAGFNIVSLAEGHLPLVHFKRKLRQHEAWSEQITVEKRYRGRRLATELRGRMFEILKEKGIKKFYGGAQVSNVASLKLARKVGFVEIADMQYLKIFTREKLFCRRYRA